MIPPFLNIGRFRAITRKGGVSLLLLCLLLNSKFSFAAAQINPTSASGSASSAAAPSTLEERLQQIITVEYKDADLGSVLRSLALTYRLNLLTGPDIKGKVTINLQEITVEKALEAILKANGLLFSKRDGVIYVSSGDASMVDVSTEVIQLKYLTATQAQNMARKIL